MLGAVVAAIAGASASASPDPVPRVRVEYSVDAGLPQGTVQALLQTRNGFVWAGTQAGLARLDGLNVQEAAPFIGAGIAALAEDAQGDLWVATAGQGLHRCPGGALDACRVVLAAGSVYAMVEDEGAMLAGGEGTGLVRIGPGGDGVQLLLPDAPGLVIHAILRDERGTWVATGGAGLLHRAPGGRTLEAVPAAPSRIVLSLARGSAGELWLGASDGLYRLEGGAVSRQAGVDAGTGVRCLQRDGAGDLWVGTRGRGLFHLDGASGEAAPEPALSGEGVLAILEDREGGLWIGTESSGLIALRPGRVRTHGEAEGLPHRAVTSVAAAPGGAVWVGTFGGGAARFEGGTFRAMDGLPPFVSCVDVLPDGRIAFGTLDDGLYLLEGGALRRVGREEGLDDPRVVSLAHGPDGRLWIGTEAGGVFLEHEGRVAPSSPSLAAERVSAILPLANAVWVGTRGGGLLRLEGDTLRRWSTRDGLSSDQILALAEGSRQEVLVATAMGICRISPVSAGAVSCVDRADGLPGAGGFSLSVEERDVWMSTNHGLVAMRRDALERAFDGHGRLVSERLGREDGMRSRECSGGFQPAAARDANGRLWFATIDGVVEVDPSSTRRPAPPLAPFVGSIRVDDRLVPLPRPAPGRAGGAAVAREEPLVIPPGARSVRIEVHAPTFVAPDLVRFTYELEGLAGSASGPVPDRVVHYGALPPGEYRLLVQASRGEDAARSAATVALPLVVLPAWHERPALRAGVAGLLLALLVGSVRLRLRHASRRRQELERLVASRTRELEEVERSTRTIVDSMQEALLTLAPDGTISFANPTAVELFARPEGLAGRQVAELVTGDLGVAGGSGPSPLRRCHVVRPDGTLLPVEASVSDVSSDREARRALLLRDVSEREKLDEDKRAFLANVSHELRTPLTSLLGSLALLTRPSYPDRVRELAGVAERSARRMARLTNDILDLERLERGEIRMDPRPCRVADLCAAAVEEARPLAAPRGVEIALGSCEGEVLADPGRIDQVLSNLLGNAVKFSPEGARVLVEASPVDAAPEGAVELRVVDRGRGVPAGQRERIFERFRQARPSDGERGVGLGLAICRSIVHGHGGTIGVRENDGAGSTFWLRLPAARDGDR